MNHLIELATQLIISFIQMSGYWGIFGLMVAESALIPIPSEVTMPFAGFLASTGVFNIWLVIIVGALANLTGSLLSYALGFWGEETFLQNLIKKYGKYLLISIDEYTRAEKWFRKYGERIVLISRILPVIRTFISLPAGVAEMNIWRFSIFTLIGSLIWSAFLAWLGFSLGKNWHSIEGIYRKFEYIVVLLIVCAVVFYIWHKVKKLRNT